MTKERKRNIVIFNKEDSDSTLFGFAIMNSDDAALFMKAIKLLSANGVSFYADNVGDILYSSADFSSTRVAKNELDVLMNVFDFDDDFSQRLRSVPRRAKRCI